MENYDPSFLAELDEESQFLQRRNRTDRFSLKNVGDSAIIRVLPYAFNDKGLWYGRMARHWIGQRPYTCVTDTAIHLGGDPDKVCPLCSTINDLVKHPKSSVNKAALRMTAVPQWLVMIVLIETISASGTSQKFKGSELKKAQEFWMYKEAFSDLLSIYKNYLRRVSPLSILDPDKGCDLFMTKAKRGFRFEREEANYMYKDKDEMAKVLKTVSFKPEAPPEDSKIDELCDKIEDICHSARDDDRRGGGSGSDRSDSRGSDRGRSSTRDDDRPRDDDRGSSRRGEDRSPSRDDDRTPATSRSRDDDRSTRRDDDRAPATRTEDRGRDDDRGAQSETRSRREEPQDDRRSSRDDDARGERVTREDPPVEDADRGEDRRRERDPEDDAPPQPKRTEAARRTISSPPAASGSSGGRSSTIREDETEEDLPDRDTDLAPAGIASKTEVESPSQDQPKTDPKPTSSLQNSIRDRIKSVRTT